MDSEQKLFEEQKRHAYLFILPVIAASLVLNLLIAEEIRLVQAIHFILLFSILACWGLLWARLPLAIPEILILVVSLIYLLSAILSSLFVDMLAQGEPRLGDFILFLPLIIVLVFLILERKQTVIACFTLLLLMIAPAIPVWGSLTSSQINSLITMYVSLFVYTFLSFFLHILYRRRAEQRAIARFAYLDALTGAANRHRIDEWLAEKTEQADREGTEFSVILFDMDHFKRVNDRHGHKTGDDVLRQMADIVRMRLGAGERFGRWGGEEFIVITDEELPGAMVLAERLCEAIGSRRFGKAGKVTASFGVAGELPGDTPERLLNRADERMYHSKRTGRNRVTGEKAEG
ncbi:diguanylate cyclase (GGDEF) domain-containing protein [Bhargavaea beijingensis]|uniref:Diguanylate cyclase (GGDEF) domain-containing protein n=1 Tax=Bhargavaea beijingensis TaxID=426756 RepID=A0A1G6YA09_9BACL|nr:diguanylate cyclase [Bhargavaea beijingensis]SDD87259.1 diguanylate cyclase (GGDEF) domain-containing protein [Bhargavaea beijingensis]